MSPLRTDLRLERDDTEAPLERGERALLIISPAIGLVYGLLARLVFGFPRFSDALGVITVSYIFVVPVVVGVLSVLLLPERKARRWSSWLGYPAGASLLTALATLVLAWEGLICAVVWLPLFIVLAVIGGILTGVARRIWSSRRSRVMVFGIAAVAPFVLAPFEVHSARSGELRTVVDRIAIAAPPAIVWEEIREVPPIDPSELPPAFTHRIGFPRPIAARLEGSGVGAVRYASFEKGVLFVEEITEWEPGRVLAFDITPENVPARAFDEHVAIGGRYFNVLRGRYEIEPGADGGSVLVLSSEQRLATPFNWYARLWTGYFMSDIQENILEVIKARSERAKASHEGRR